MRVEVNILPLSQSMWFEQSSISEVFMKITSYLTLTYSTPAGLSKEAHKALRKYSLTGQNTVNFSEWQITNKQNIIKHSM
jgi:hypothetical protein